MSRSHNQADKSTPKEKIIWKQTDYGKYWRYAGSNKGSYSGGKSNEGGRPTTQTTYQKKSTDHDKPKALLSQPALDWKSQERYVELLNFEMEVANVLQAKTYDLNHGRCPS